MTTLPLTRRAMAEYPIQLLREIPSDELRSLERLCYGLASDAQQPSHLYSWMAYACSRTSESRADDLVEPGVIELPRCVFANDRAELGRALEAAALLVAIVETPQARAFVCEVLADLAAFARFYLSH